jgi:hypothetical protein
MFRDLKHHWPRCEFYISRNKAGKIEAVSQIALPDDLLERGEAA